MYLPGAATIFQANGVDVRKGGQLVVDCVVTEFGKPTATSYLWVCLYLNAQLRFMCCNNYVRARVGTERRAARRQD